ncbi:hypothetical protein E2F47_01215 [Mycobacterium eburneum]|nr:hypothetical protein [Mycobacterium eburneum]TDH57812.1 hypothetical protein E2F47_01215 [Mycobacterium eburneum]
MSTAASTVRRLGVVPDAAARPVIAADAAQAKLFDELLQAEIVELEELARAAEARRSSRRETGAAVPAELRQRIAEAHRLRAALRARFPLNRGS